MKQKLIFKITVDIAMTGALLFLMSYSMIGDMTHEILGTAMLVLLILHHILNVQWHKNLFKGRYTALRLLQLIEVNHAKTVTIFPVGSTARQP